MADLPDSGTPRRPLKAIREDQDRRAQTTKDLEQALQSCANAASRERRLDSSTLAEIWCQYAVAIYNSLAESYRGLPVDPEALFGASGVLAGGQTRFEVEADLRRLTVLRPEHWDRAGDPPLQLVMRNILGIKANGFAYLLDEPGFMYQISDCIAERVRHWKDRFAKSRQPPPPPEPVLEDPAHEPHSVGGNPLVGPVEEAIRMGRPAGPEIEKLISGGAVAHGRITSRKDDAQTWPPWISHFSEFPLKEHALAQLTRALAVAQNEEPKRHDDIEYFIASQSISSSEHEKLRESHSREQEECRVQCLRKVLIAYVTAHLESRRNYFEMRTLLPLLYVPLLNETFFGGPYILEPFSPEDSEYLRITVIVEDLVGNSSEWRQFVKVLDGMAEREGVTERASSFTFKQLVTVAPEPEGQGETHSAPDSTRTDNASNEPVLTAANRQANIERLPKEDSVGVPDQSVEYHHTDDTLAQEGTPEEELSLDAGGAGDQFTVDEQPSLPSDAGSVDKESPLAGNPLPKAKRRRGPKPDDEGHQRIAKLLPDDWETDLPAALNRLDPPADDGPPILPSRAWCRTHKITRYSEVHEAIGGKEIRQHLSRRRDIGKELLRRKLTSD